MSITCENFIKAVLKKMWALAFTHLNGLSMYEMVRALAALDPADLKELLAHKSMAADQSGMPRIGYAEAAMAAARHEGDLPKTAPGDLTQTGQVHDAQMYVHKPTPLVFEHDLTGRLPAATPSGRLTDTDYQQAATGLGVETAAIHAVAHVESGGRSGFGAGDRPVLRFELHWFQDFTKRKYHVTHPHLSQPSLKAGNPYHHGGQANEYSMLYGAMILRNQVENAWSSASWGMFQVMGFNHSGSADVETFVKAMYESEKKQLATFLAYCKDNNLVKALKNHDWATFARGYNGESYAVNNYDTNLANAYARYANPPKPHAHHAHHAHHAPHHHK